MTPSILSTPRTPWGVKIVFSSVEWIGVSVYMCVREIEGRMSSAHFKNSTQEILPMKVCLERDLTTNKDELFGREGFIIPGELLIKFPQQHIPAIFETLTSTKDGT